MIRVVLAGLAVALLVLGCGKKPESEAVLTGCVIEGASAPEWVCDSRIFTDRIAASGHAAKGGDYGQQLSDAQAGARNAQLRQSAEAIRTSFMILWREEARTIDSATEAALEELALEVARQTVAGSRIHDSWQHPVSGTLYTLVVAPLDETIAHLEQALQASESLAVPDRSALVAEVKKRLSAR